MCLSLAVKADLYILLIKKKMYSEGCNGHIAIADSKVDEDQITQYIQVYVKNLFAEKWKSEKGHPFEYLKELFKNLQPNTEIESKMSLISSMEMYALLILTNPNDNDPTAEECNGHIANYELFASSVDNSEMQDQNQRWALAYILFYMKDLVNEEWKKTKPSALEDFKKWLEHHWPNTYLHEIDSIMNEFFIQGTYLPWILSIHDETGTTAEGCNDDIDTPPLSESDEKKRAFVSMRLRGLAPQGEPPK